MSETYARLEAENLEPAHELSALARGASDDGAVVSFVGLARATSKAGEPVEALVLQHHPRLTENSLHDIAAAAMQRFPVTRVRVVHRCGTIFPGQAIVFAGATSPHRRAAFDAADYLMDRLKTDAIFWKREESRSGANWIEPSDADYTARKRWD